MNEQEITNEEIKNPEVKKEHKKPELKKKEANKFKEEIALLHQQNADLNDKLLRVTAEMQNIKRRSEESLANAYKYDGIDLVEKLLPIIDNFERALNVKSEGNEKFLEGFKMIYDNFISILSTKGIKEIEALNKPFDPSIMNAVLTEVNNEIEENTVIDVLQKGYEYNSRVIRPAMVKVSTKDN